MSAFKFMFHNNNAVLLFRVFARTKSSMSQSSVNWW